MLSSLKTKLALSHVAVVLITAIFLGLVSYWIVFTVHKNETFQYLQKGSVNSSYHVNHFLTHKKLILEKIAESKEVSIYLKKFQEPALRDYFKIFSEDLDSISLILPDGREETKFEEGQPTSQAIKNYTGDQQFQQAINEPDNFIIAISYPKYGDWPNVIFMLAKEHYFSGKPLFVLRGTISLEKLKTYLVEFTQSTSDFLMMTDENDKVIVHPDHKMLGKKVSFASQTGIAGADRLGVKGIYCTHKVDSPPWLMINVIPYDAYLEDPYKYAKSILLVFSCAIILSLLAAYKISAKLNRPLKDLTTAVKKVASGETVYKLPPYFIEELDNLVDAFNTMNFELAESTISKEYSDSILNSIKECLIVTSIDGTIESANKSAFVILGCSEKWLLGRSIAEILPGSFNFDNFREVACPEEGIETTFKSLEGTEKPIHFFYSVQRDKVGTKVGFVCLGLDISRRKKIEAEKEALKVKLQQAQRLETVGTLASGIAHDFNNILTIIIGYCQILNMTLKDEEDKKSTKEILAASNRAKDLVRQLLDFSRQVEHAMIVLDMKPILKEIGKMLKASFPASIEIILNIEEGVPSIWADPSQIQQMIMNLCNNSLQAMMDGGSLKISLTTEEVSADNSIKYSGTDQGQYVKLVISDTGTGIKKSNIEQIFDPFFTTKGVHEGTGLGLAVVHGIVTKMNSHIFVESKENVGTTFTILIPTYHKDEEANPDKNGSTSLLYNGEGKHILFVDDEQPLANLGKNALSRYGFKVTAITSSLEALAIFSAQPDDFDVVITDFAMPKMRGDELIQKMQAQKSNLPAILCTGYHAQLVKVEEIIGTHRIIKKPYSIEKIVANLMEILPEKSPEKPSTS